MKKFIQGVLPLILSTLALVLVIASLHPDSARALQGVTNFDSLELSGDLTVDGDSTFTGDVIPAGGVDLNGNDLVVDADADSILDENTDDAIRMTLGVTTGTFSVLTGNLKVGNGTPTVTQDGEDAYFEGQVEVDGEAQFDGAIDANGSADFASGVTVSSGGISVDAGLATFAGGINCTPQTEVVTAAFVITPTSCIVSMTSAAVVTSSATTGIITTTANSGDIIILANNNASDIINVDGTGGTVECKANVALGASDTLMLWYNGVDEKWNCVSGYDNS